MHVCARVLGALACEFITTIHHCTQRKEFNYGQKRIPRIPGEDAERGGGICGETAPPSGEQESFGGGGGVDVYING